MNKPALRAIAAMVALCALLLTGSTSRAMPPPIYIDTKSLDFSAGDTERTFTIYNYGEEAESWSVDRIADITSEDIDWIHVAPDNGTVAVGGSQTVYVTVNREGLAPGSYNAFIILDFTLSGSYYMDFTIQVSATAQGSPQLHTSSDLLFVQPGIEYGVHVENAGTGLLVWNVEEIQYASGNDWITYEPSGGDVQENAHDVLTLMVDNSGLRPGFYSAVLSIASNGGNKNLVIILLPFVVKKGREY